MSEEEHLREEENKSDIRWRTSTPTCEEETRREEGGERLRLDKRPARKSSAVKKEASARD